MKLLEKTLHNRSIHWVLRLINNFYTKINISLIGISTNYKSNMISFHRLEIFIIQSHIIQVSHQGSSSRPGWFSKVSFDQVELAIAYSCEDGRVREHQVIDFYIQILVKCYDQDQKGALFKN